MSIASGFTKMKNYILTSSGYKLLSRWTSSQTVHMGDGTDDTDTVEYRFGAMKGVTSSLATDNDEFALSASAGKNLQDQCTQLNQSLTQLNEGIFKEPIQINYIYNYTSEVQKVFEYECEETGIYVINMSGGDFYTHCFITDKRYAAQIAAMSNNGVATKIQCTNQYKMYKGHKYNIELWNATFQMYKY